MHDSRHRCRPSLYDQKAMKQFFKQFFPDNSDSLYKPTEAELIYKHNLANETQKEVYRAYLSQRNITIPDYLKLDTTFSDSDS